MEEQNNNKKNVDETKQNKTKDVNVTSLPVVYATQAKSRKAVTTTQPKLVVEYRPCSSRLIYCLSFRKIYKMQCPSLGRTQYTHCLATRFTLSRPHLEQGGDNDDGEQHLAVRNGTKWPASYISAVAEGAVRALESTAAESMQGTTGLYPFRLGVYTVCLVSGRIEHQKRNKTGLV